MISSRATSDRYAGFARDDGDYGQSAAALAVRDAEYAGVACHKRGKTYL